MIVVDSNVVAYCWMRGALTPLAQRVRATDPDWHVPILWRSELRSILAGYLRDASLAFEDVVRIMAAAERGLAGGEHVVDSARVLAVIRASRLSAYGAELVALAEALSVRLITADRAVLRAYPEVTVTMDAFVRG